MLPTKSNFKKFLILAFFFFAGIGVYGQQTYLDNFSTVSYSNNNGSSNFSAGWDENNDGDSPTGGNIRISSNQLRFDDLDSDDRIGRTLNLSGFSAVTLTLDYDATSRGNEGLNVQLWNDTSSSWETVASISSSVTGSISHILTANQISNNSEIRFVSNSSGWSSGERIYVDNVLLTTATFCTGQIFVDSGGASGNYSNDEDEVYTLCPETANTDLSVNFTNFDVESGWDFLYIYEGTSTGGTLIGQYDSSNVPGIITSTDPTGCLTFRFTSDGSVTRNGWQATISCLPRTPRISVTDVSVDEDAGTMDFTVNHSGLAASGPYTVTYSTSDVTASAGNDYTGIVNGALNFDGTTGDSDIISVSITDDSLYENPETFTISFTATSDPAVDISDTAIGTINDNEIILNNPNLVLTHEFDGYIGYTSTGGTLRTQDNNTNACSITTSSSNTLTAAIPATATIDRAFLYWAHSNPNPDSQVTFEGNTVNADVMYTTSLSGGRVFYGGVSDVTSIVSGITNINTNSFDFSGLNVDNSATYCNSATVLGGWSLMVFFSDPNLLASTINVYQGFHGESNTSSTYTLDGFYAIGASGSKTTALSWEGDQTLSNNEALEFTTSTGTNDLVGDGDNTSGSPNPFNSTIYDNTGGTVVNNTAAYGVDLDTYDVSPYISVGETSATTRIESGQDFVILNAVVLKVPSNLVTGTVFEDINYGGGAGRDLASSSGVPIEGVELELYDNSGTRIQTTTTDASGSYVFGGMANGTFSIRVVNNTVRSTRSGGTSCTSCMPVQTFKTDYVASILIPDINAVGGENPSSTDPSANTLTGAQSVSSMTIVNEGVAGMDFGFNFNTIVNTNEDGQGSLEQFIVNANNLGETGLDIVTNSIFNPAAGEDTSIFMIPPTSDLLGRTADSNFASGYFDILISNGSPLTTVDGTNTIIDGRTQTAYSGDTNTGTIGSGGTTVGTSAITLPDYELPEIQIHKNNGDVFRAQGNSTVIRNLSIYGGNNAGLRIDGGSVTVSNNLLGVTALGVNAGGIDNGIEVINGTVTIDSNYIATNTDEGVHVDGGTSTIIQNNHITNNGEDACGDNILIEGGSGILIQQNLIENASSLGIDGDGISGNISISENTITSSGQDGGSCSGNVENAGILLDGSNSTISNNIIALNGGSGIVLAGGNTSGNLISQNSIYANGTAADALGIDLDLADGIGDGVTLNETGDADNGPNEGLNFPIIETAYKSGSNVVISGWSRPGATIEFFLTDISLGTAGSGDNQLGLSTDYGEGQTFLASLVEGGGSDSDSATSPYTDIDGNTDNTNRFTFTFTAPGIVLGDDLTATATISNSTSEFSPFSKLKAYTIITNRRITYRVKKN